MNMVMRSVWFVSVGLCLVGVFVLTSCQYEPIESNDNQQTDEPGLVKKEIPLFEFDETWPRLPLPNKWILGTVVGVAVDTQDHIWIAQRPTTLRPDELEANVTPPLSNCCKPAPSVIEFDYEGNVVQAWGGASPTNEYEWPSPGEGSPDPTAGGGPSGEHSVFVDHNDNVWLTSTGPGDAQILKFTRNGDFLLQIGRHGQNKGSNDTENLGMAAGLQVYPGTNELFVADGYGNRRVIVFDADTGNYLRHWGAYGNRPDDSVPFQYDPNIVHTQFSTVHGIGVSNDGLVYACDRNNSRIQVFRLDGSFVKEALIEPQTLSGTVFGIAFSADPEQRFAYIPDGRNMKVWILERDSLEIIGSVGYGGHFAGGFITPHGIATDSQGNMYVGETWEGKRVQRFLYKGLRTFYE